eukprot:scaffold1708_cov117-Isochrysis_galbana.AAC.9
MIVWPPLPPVMAAGRRADAVAVRRGPETAALAGCASRALGVACARLAGVFPTPPPPAAAFPPQRALHPPQRPLRAAPPSRRLLEADRDCVLSLADHGCALGIADRA